MSTTSPSLLLVTTKAEFIKPYTPKEMRVMYNVSEKTFRNWIRPFMSEIGRRTAKSYTTLQVGKIFSYIGYPPNVVFTDEK